MNKIEALLKEARSTEFEHPLDALAAVTNFDLHRRGNAAFISEAAYMLRKLKPRLSREQSCFIADEIDKWWKEEPESAWVQLRDTLRHGTAAAFFCPERLVHVETCSNCHKPVLSAFNSGKQWTNQVHHKFCPTCGYSKKNREQREERMMAVPDLRRRIFAFIIIASILLGIFSILTNLRVIQYIAGILFLASALGTIY